MNGGRHELLALALLSIVTGFASAQEFDGKTTPEGIKTLANQKLALQLRSGLIINDATFVGTINDPRTGSVKFIDYLNGRRSAKAKAEDVYRMIIAGRAFYLRYHGPTHTYHFIDEAVADTQVDERLLALGRERTESNTPESLKEQNAEHLKFADDAVTKIGNPALRIEENDFAILITDLPAPQTRMFSQFIPPIFRNLNSQFGIPINETVLPGKAVIAFFGQRETYAAFEKEVMNNPNYGTSTGMVHFSGTRFVSVGVDKTFDIGSVRGICWGVAGGYANRFYSNVALPAWLAAGLPGSLADSVLPRDEKSVRQDRESVARTLKRSGSLNAILDATNIDMERKPIAKLLVQFLIARDSVAATQYVRDLKSGQEPVVALQNNFGLTHETFALEFGRALGVPNLRP